MGIVIDSFKGENFYLSNFYEALVTYGGITFRNNEAAFQAHKCEDPEARKEFVHLNPSEAKKKGRHVKLRPDWEDVKTDIMRGIVWAKFTQNHDLADKLLSTGDAVLEEGNNWGDRIWGVVWEGGRKVGENRLGRILMDTRRKLKQRGNAELIVLERSNGWYGGYEQNEDGTFCQVFNTDARLLFMSIRCYTDKGYTVKCLGKESEEEFMAKRTTLQKFMEGSGRAIIWRYETPGPFALGGVRRAIKTKINLYNHKTAELGKGFAGVVIPDGEAKGVYELISGGLVGDTLENVMADIEACDDISMMQGQIENAACIRDTEGVMVSNEKFGLPAREEYHE